jgi:hypothetical protein
MEAVNPTGEPSRLEEKRRHLLALCERRLSQGRARLMSRMAVVRQGEAAGVLLVERQLAQFVDTVTMQVERLDTLDLEMSLQEEARTVEVDPVAIATTQLSLDTVMAVLERQIEEAREQTRQVGLAWADLALNRRKRQRQRQESTPGPEEQSGGDLDEQTFAERAAELRALRGGNCLELRDLLDQLVSRIPLFEVRLKRLQRPGDDLDVSLVDVLQADLSRIVDERGNLYNLVKQHYEELLRHDCQQQSLLRALLDTQLDLDSLRIRIRDLKQV